MLLGIPSCTIKTRVLLFFRHRPRAKLQPASHQERRSHELHHPEPFVFPLHRQPPAVAGQRHVDHLHQVARDLGQWSKCPRQPFRRLFQGAPVHIYRRINADFGLRECTQILVSAILPLAGGPMAQQTPAGAEAWRTIRVKARKQLVKVAARSRRPRKVANRHPKVAAKRLLPKSSHVR